MPSFRTDILRLHRLKLLLATGTAMGLAAWNLGMGSLRPAAEHAWIDLLGEGGTALMIAVWTWLILASRPAGRVTNLLYAGLLLLFASFFQDFSDELITLPEPLHQLHNWLESGLMLLGMGTLTLGIYQLHREQLVIIDQLRRRERYVRDHDRVDRVTRLGDAGYLRLQLELELARANAHPAVLVVDVSGFNRINREHGADEGDRMLGEIGDLLLMNLRQQDLLCRYAGDRFVALLPEASEATVRELANQLDDAVRHFCFRAGRDAHPVRHRICIGAALGRREPASRLLARATAALEVAKRAGDGALQLAA